MTILIISYKHEVEGLCHDFATEELTSLFKRLACVHRTLIPHFCTMLIKQIRGRFHDGVTTGDSELSFYSSYGKAMGEY